MSPCATLAGKILAWALVLLNAAAALGLAILLGSQPPCAHWQMLLVDDGSSDAGPRPAGDRWVGKTWPWSRAMEQVESDWVLFVDDDVRLQPAALLRALAQAEADGRTCSVLCQG